MSQPHFWALTDMFAPLSDEQMGGAKLPQPPAPALPDYLTDIFGEPISVYTREQAIEDGTLVDVSEWAGPDQMTPGYRVPVCFTRALWELVDVEARLGWSAMRGRAHDVLWMASLPLQAGRSSGRTKVKLGRKNYILRVELDGDGVTIGLPEGF